MATRAESRAAAPPSTELKAGRTRPGSGIELWSWLFMRLSGIVLLFLAVGHVLIMHAFDEGIDRVNFAFVQLRWASPFWKTWDWLLLILALIHGVNGLRVITTDYVRRPKRRTAVNWLFAIVGLASLVLGTVIVVTFDPAKWPAP